MNENWSNAGCKRLAGIFMKVHHVRWILLFTLLAAVFSACSSTPKYTPPPPTPISYSGPAPDPDWIAQKTQQYTNSGTDQSQAAFDARLAYLKKSEGYADIDPPKPVVNTHGSDSHSTSSTTRNNSAQHPPSPTAPPLPPTPALPRLPHPRRPQNRPLLPPSPVRPLRKRRRTAPT